MDQLNVYIQQARQQGQADEQIRQDLLGVGWSLEQVNGVLPLAVPAARRRSKLPFVSVGVVVALLIIIGVLFATVGHKTSYQTVIQEFITAIQTKDKAKADVLESPAAKSTFLKVAHTSNFYSACQQLGDFCNGSFKSSFLSKGSKTYKDYTASNGTKGKEVVYAIKQSLNGAKAGGQGCNSSSTTTITIAVVPKGNSWLVDNVDEGVDASGNLCPVSGYVN